MKWRSAYTPLSVRVGPRVHKQPQISSWGRVSASKMGEAERATLSNKKNSGRGEYM